MPTRTQRSKGSGSIYRNSRGQYVAAVEVGWSPRGTRRRLTLKARTLREVRARLADLQAQVAAEGCPAIGGSLTVKQWAERWLGMRERELRPGTFVADRSAVTRWIVPAVGHQRLDALQPADVRKIAANQEAAGLALPSMQRTHAVLRKMLTDAVAEGYRVSQRARETPGPGNGPTARQALGIDEAVRVLKVAAARPDTSRWVAALVNGLRPGEALGLTWDMVDLDAGTMTLAWQLKPLPYRDRRQPSSGFRVPRGFESRHLHGAYHLVRPKTLAGVRVVPMTQQLIAELRRWRRLQPPSSDLVWPRADGTPRSAEFDRAQWYAIVDEAGVTVTLPDGTTRRPLLYEARHTAATLLLASGIDETTIKSVLGHSTIISTQSYLHTDRTRMRAALAASAGLLGLDG